MRYTFIILIYFTYLSQGYGQKEANARISMDAGVGWLYSPKAGEIPIAASLGT